MELIIAAISLGFLGSFHCVGMCGPIALALPVNHQSFLMKWIGILSYNFGRMFTYALLGSLFGLIGQGLFIAGYQQSVSIILGIAMLIMVLLPNSYFSKYKLTGFIFSGITKLKSALGQLLKKGSLSTLFFLGTLNGLLPCGLVYLGIAGSIATGNSLNGALFMTMFGLGTLPAMASLSMLGNVISLNFRNKIKRAMPVVVIATALLLILRGMNLGIPYISPQMSDNKAEVQKCCHK